MDPYGARPNGICKDIDDRKDATDDPERETRHYRRESYRQTPNYGGAHLERFHHTLPPQQHLPLQNQRQSRWPFIREIAHTSANGKTTQGVLTRQKEPAKWLFHLREATLKIEKAEKA